MTEDEQFSGVLSSQVLALENLKNSWKKKYRELENVLYAKNEKINKLQLELKFEKFKNSFFTHLVKTQTDFNVDEIWNYSDDGVRIQHQNDGVIPIILQNLLNDDSKVITTVSMKKKNPKVGQTFRTVKHKVELLEEDPEKQENKVKEVDNEMEEIAQEHGLDFSLKDININIDKAFEEVVKSRLYSKTMSAITEQRVKLLGKLGLDEYTKTIQSHISRAENIFHKKKYDTKKISSIISKSLTPLEQHLTSYGTYYSSNIEPDEIQKVKVALKLNTVYPKRYVPFSTTDFLSKLYNYSIALFPLRDNLKRAILNPYGFPNIIYSSFDKHQDDDPYSFYLLDTIGKDGKRSWKMECRLDDFSKSISNNIKSYCISLFRKIYLDMFNDNTFRENYKDKYPIALQDCEQLLENLVLLSKPKSLCELFRLLVMKYCTIHPTALDKFNFTADDKINKRHFATETDTSEEILSTVKRLFDDISEEDAQKFCDNLNTL